MCLASGKMALRVRMKINLLAQGIDFLLRSGNPLPYPGRRSAASNVMHREHRCRLQKIVEALVEHRIQSSQLIEREILKLATFLHAQLYCLADLFVREPRRHAASDQISRCRPCV